MKYASVSVKFPTELDAEIERFIEETGVYTNKSEFIKEACREHLKGLHDDAAIAALRLAQLLARAEQSQQRDDEIAASLRELAENVDPEELERAVEASRADTAESIFETDA
jgi:Arc/MetJ-type ribon-helix-helix transcriptional regulator